MRNKAIAGSTALLLAAASGFWSGGCGRTGGEAPITGKSAIGPVTMQGEWPAVGRFIYRVVVVVRSQIPNRYTGQLIEVETTIGQDLAFRVTRSAPNGMRDLMMEILAVQVETAKDDNVTLSYDSANKVFFMGTEDLAEQLQKLVGMGLTFHLTPGARVARVEGAKELAAQLAGRNNPVTGISARILSRSFSERFFRDLVEMWMLPGRAIKVGESWPPQEGMRAGSGLYGSPFAFGLTCRLRGWQRLDGTNCLRIDFEAVSGKGTGAPTGSPGPGTAGVRVNPGVKEGWLRGRSWFNPDLSLIVETACDESATTESVQRRRPAMAAAAATNETEAGADPAPPGDPAGAAQAGEAKAIRTTTTQHTWVKLVAVE